MSGKVFRVGIINVTGYVGLELVRLLSTHPQVQIVSATGRSQVGQKLSAVFPQIDVDLTITESLSGEEEVVFSAMPHGTGVSILTPLVDKGIKVIDLSADFRLNKASDYTQWYSFVHTAPEYLSRAVYGLPEINREAIKHTNFVACPGCYPTSVILALAPALKQGLVGSHIIADCKSGISGAGRSLTLSSHFCEANEGVTPYATAIHRHQPEMVQECAKIFGQSVNLTFSPHLVPMTRGIMASCYAPLAKLLNRNEVLAWYKEFYRNEPFVRVLDNPPSSKLAYGSNKAFVYVTLDELNGRLIAFGAIDNLGKGAAGQAVQNMNLMCGLPEDTGLSLLPTFP